MTDAAPLVLSLARTLEPYRHYRRWWIACSGGVDSLVLLHATIALTRDTSKPWPSLAVIHINHQLNPRAADWAHHVSALCGEWSVPCVVRTVSVSDIADSGLEAAAREQRYAAFADVLEAGDLLLQAHHRDDQIETLLLRMLRGSGLAGLRAIPATRSLGRGHLLRPLLDCTRAELVDYANTSDLRWIDDDSNRDTHYDRNFLRHQVLPLIEQRWPGYRETLNRVATQADEADALLREIAAADLESVMSADGSLDISALQMLSLPRQHHVLRLWLARRQLPAPSRAQLDEIVSAVTAAIDAEPCVRWPGGEVRRFRGELCAMPPLPAPTNFELSWSPLNVLPLPGGGSLAASGVNGSGLRADRSYTVRNRVGGERCHPVSRAHSQTLKKLLQEVGLAPWWRDRVPLIYCGDALAAVGDLWVCRGFEAAPDAPGWQLAWTR